MDDGWMENGCWMPSFLPLQLVAVIVRHAVPPPYGVLFRLCAFLVPVLERETERGSEKAPGQQYQQTPSSPRYDTKYYSCLEVKRPLGLNPNVQAINIFRDHSICLLIVKTNKKSLATDVKSPNSSVYHQTLEYRQAAARDQKSIPGTWCQSTNIVKYIIPTSG